MPTQPRLITTADEMQRYSREARRVREVVGLVPTMGYLHEGHLSLVDAARAAADRVVVSIYVNPTQFGPSEDLATYPRDTDGDMAKLAVRGVDVVFMPSDEAMYPNGYCTSVAVSGLTEGLCGASRPTHFGGVTTIVTKLFNLVGPDIAVFGRKDYQQLAVIKRMVRDLNMPVRVIGSPIVREGDGLAMSSRNAYLSDEERAAAPALHRALTAVRTLYRAGERSREALLTAARQIISAEAPLRIDYATLVEPDDLRELSHAVVPEHVHMAVAVFAGQTRLIDNMRISEDAP